MGATWVLTPTPTTDPAAYARVGTVLAEVGAEVIALDPELSTTPWWPSCPTCPT